MRRKREDVPLDGRTAMKSSCTLGARTTDVCSCFLYKYLLPGLVTSIVIIILYCYDYDYDYYESFPLIVTHLT